jgi:hypothetical protein
LNIFRWPIPPGVPSVIQPFILLEFHAGIRSNLFTELHPFIRSNLFTKLHPFIRSNFSAELHPFTLSNFSAVFLPFRLKESHLFRPLPCYLLRIPVSHSSSQVGIPPARSAFLQPGPHSSSQVAIHSARQSLLSCKDFILNMFGDLLQGVAIQLLRILLLPREGSSVKFIFWRRKIYLSSKK